MEGPKFQNCPFRMDYLWDIFYNSSQSIDSNDESLKAKPEALMQRATYLALQLLQVILLRGSQGGLIRLFLFKLGFYGSGSTHEPT